MYAQVLIQHPYARINPRLTYEVPPEMKLKEGQAVLVPFQKGKQAGLVLSLGKDRPEHPTKLIDSLLEEVHLHPWQMDLAGWISEYYFCSKYDALKLFLPKNIWKEQKRKATPHTKATTSKAKSKKHELTPRQSEIVESILNEQKNVSLIRGITGSGKTEIYKHLIEATLKMGKQAILLVPEIALTPQLLKAFKGNFPQMAVLHSRITEAKKATLWKQIHKGEIQLVLGSRSALFAPLPKLGLIILDEEHEWTYKQEQSPRYHARDAAVKLAKLTGAKLVLGSATPSLESMHKAETNEYNFYSIEERILGTELPKVQIVDMCEELKGQNYSIFSALLEQKISSTLTKKEQIILFLNRRGSASATLCRDCGKAAECDRCDTRLTYHDRNHGPKTLVCHHCGGIRPMPDHCPNCKGNRIKQIGIGTEKVEQELKKLFPTARVFRADKDSMNQAESYTELHEKLQNGEIDILIGTQMIGKGFDIPNVTLVGVLLADLGLHVPDFRASERSFQLLTQVAGRAGRRESQGEVIIQTYNPRHSAIQHSKDHHYKNFYAEELQARKEAQLPPFSKLIKCVISAPDKKTCQERAEALKTQLQNLDNTHQIFIAPALIAKIKNKYTWHLLIQGPDPRSLLKKLQPQDLENWRIDVDPVHVV